MKSIWIGLAWLVAPSALAASFEPELSRILRSYDSDIHHPETKALIGRSERRPEADGSTTRAYVRSYDAAGQKLSEEVFTYRGRSLERYEVRRLNVDEVGVVEWRGDSLRFEYTRRGKKKEDSEKLSSQPTLVNDTIVPYAVQNWDRLMGGEELEFRLVVADRLETVGFKLLKDHEAVVNGRKAMAVKMKPTSFIIAGIVKPLFFMIDTAPPRTLVEYRGRLVPKIQEKGRGDPKDFDAITVVRESLSAELPAPK